MSTISAVLAYIASFTKIFCMIFFGVSVSCMLTNIWLLLKIISGLQNFDKDNVASVVTAADKVFYLTSVLLHFLFLQLCKLCNIHP